MAIIDSFDRADNASTMGTTSDGTATWTYKGTWGISSNTALMESSGGGNQSWAAVDAGTGDGTVQITMSTVGTRLAGLAFRVTDANNYLGMGSGAIFKCVAGSVSNIGSYTAEASGDVLSVVLSGSSITAKKNGTTVATITDSFGSTATKHGLVHDSTATDASRYNDFSFTPGAASPAARHKTITVAGRAITRSVVW